MQGKVQIFNVQNRCPSQAILVQFYRVLNHFEAIFQQTEILTTENRNNHISIILNVWYWLIYCTTFLLQDSLILLWVTIQWHASWEIILFSKLCLCWTQMVFIWEITGMEEKYNLKPIFSVERPIIVPWSMEPIFLGNFYFISSKDFCLRDWLVKSYATSSFGERVCCDH